MDITQNYFEVFGLEAMYEVDLKVLSVKYRELQKQVHPDKFANATDREKRISVQYAAFINEAFNVLKSPLLRASYLLELLVGDLIQFQSVQVPPMFLMEQVELREELSEVADNKDPEAALENMSADVRKKLKALSDEFSEELSEQNFESAYQSIMKMQFMEKISTEIEALEEALLD